MTAIHVGDDGSALVIQPGFPILRRGSDGSFELEFLYWASKAVAESLLPPVGDASTETGHTDLILDDAEIFPHQDPTAVFVRLFYRDPTVLTQQVGTTIRESDAAIQEFPIEKKAGINQGQIDDLKANGILTFFVPSVTYSRTEFKGSFTFSEANLVEGVGFIDNSPEGLSAPTANRWMKTALIVRKAGSDVEVRETWQYDTNGWDTVLYT